MSCIRVLWGGGEWGNLKERKNLEKLDIDGSITLKGILKRLRGRGMDLSDLG